MKASRSYFLVIGLGIVALFIVNLVSLYGHFKSLDNAGSSIPSEGRLKTQMHAFHENLKNIDSTENAKLSFKAFESGVGFGPGSEGAEMLRKNYDPILALYGSKPKEAEQKFLISKKQALMEGLVNAYRKEVQHGPVPVRAIYLNLLFDTQNSLLNESDEAEQVYVKKSRDNFSTLKSITAGAADTGLPLRVANLESIFSSYERGFSAVSKWRGDRAELLEKIEKNSAKFLKEIKSRESNVAEDARRGFLYNSILVLVVSIVVGIIFYLTQKLFVLRFESRAESFISYLRDFGQEKDPAKFEKINGILKTDPDWSSIFVSARETENQFIAKFQTLLSIPKSLQMPYLVFSKDREVLQWNEQAGQLFNLAHSPASHPQLELVINEEIIGVKDGEAEAMVEMIKNSFSAPKEDVFEILLKDGGVWYPVELISFPIVSGPLAGGKVYLLREIRNEVARIEKAVSAEIERVRDFIHKITHHYPVDLKPTEDDLVPVREAIVDLQTMRLKNEEREALWKSEIRALIEQVERQKQFLQQLQGEILEMKDRNSDIQSLLSAIHSTDGHLHEEICLMEKDLARWVDGRQRLVQDLQEHNSVLGRVKSFESELREATNSIKTMLDSFDTEVQRLKQFRDQASVNAVNFSFSPDITHQEYAVHARAFSREINSYTEKLLLIVQAVKTFLAKHPGGSLFPLLENADIDEAILEALRDEQLRLGSFVKRWKEEGQELVSEGQRAISIIKNVEEKSLTASHLGEKSLLLNEQANKNLSRWN